MRYLLIAAAFSLFATPALAASDSVCDDKDMANTKTMVEAMQAGPDKDAAMKEYTDAQASLQQKDMTSCKNHMSSVKSKANKK